jgi:hypothetical protein
MGILNSSLLGTSASSCTIYATMSTSNNLSCICGRHFFQQNALSYHQRSCSELNTRLSNTLSRAKLLCRPKKRRRLNSNGDWASASFEADAPDLRTLGARAEDAPSTGILAESEGLQVPGDGVDSHPLELQVLPLVQLVLATYSLYYFRNRCSQIQIVPMSRVRTGKKGLILLTRIYPLLNAEQDELLRCPGGSETAFLSPCEHCHLARVDTR